MDDNPGHPESPALPEQTLSRKRKAEEEVVDSQDKDVKADGEVADSQDEDGDSEGEYQWMDEALPDN